MATELSLGNIANLKFTALPSAIFGSIVLWIVLSALCVAALQMSVGEAIVVGLVAVALHWVSDIVHQFGHAWAAARTGNPMTGIRMWGVLSSSVYPSDERPLPAAIHIRRALGGVTFSAPFTIVAGFLAFALRSIGGALEWLALFLFLDNLLIFTLGSFLPLGFTDGSTLLYWRGKP